MTRPTKHPKTGTYLVRVAIPANLRDIAKQLFGVSREFRENLRTKDATIARQRAPEAVARLRGKIERAARVASEVLPEPTTREIAALAGAWYRRRVGADYESQELREVHVDIAMTLAEEVEPDAMTTALADPEATAEGLLRDHDYAITPEGVGRLSAALRRADKEFLAFLQRHLEGDWSAHDPALAKFPRLPAKTPTSPATGCTFDTLLEGWALEHGYQVGAKPVPRALYDRLRTLERLAAFLGHPVSPRLMWFGGRRTPCGGAGQPRRSAMTSPR
jgi:hypothetical protein